MASPKHILIIDDDESIQHLLVKSLAPQGYRLTCAGRGAEALELLRSGQFDVAILDIMLPEIDGIEILRRVQGQISATEIIVLTGHASMETAIEALRLGAYDYITKPFSLNAIRSTLKRAIEKQDLTTRLAAIQTLSREMALSTDVEQAAEATLDIAEGIFELDYVALWTVDLEQGQPRLLAKRVPSSPEQDEKEPEVAPEKPSALGRVLDSGEPIYVPDTQTEPHHAASGTTPRSRVIVPLKIQQRVIGVLEVASSQTDAFSPHDVKLLSSLAAQAAIAVENARLHLQAQQEIAQRRRAEEAQRANKARLESIFRVAPTGIGLVRDRVLLEVNDRICEMAGRSRDELIGKDARLLYPTDQDYEYVGREKYRQIQKCGTGTVETRWMRKDGEIINVLLSSTPLDASDLSLGVTFTALDITERKRAEGALLESERQKELILNSTAEMVAYYDTDLRVIWANRASAESVGRAPKELVGLHCHEIWHQSSEPCPGCPVLKAREDKAPRQSEQQTPDGRHWFLRGHPILDEGGKVVALVEFGQDITERKRVQETLERSLDETAHSQRLLLALSKAAQAVQRARTPDQVFQTITDEILRLGYHAAILSVAEDRAHLSLSHLTLQPTLLRAAEKLTGLSAQGYRFPLVPGSLYHRAVTAGETVFSASSADAFAEALPESLRPLTQRLALLLGGDEAILAPLQIDGQAQSLLMVIGADLTESDLPAVTAFASQAAIAVENAQLYQAAQQEIAERVQAEKAVRASETQYRELLHSLRDGFATVDAQGRITRCNPAFEEITGYTLDELGQQNFTDLTPEKWHAMEAQILEEQALTRGYTDLYQKEYIRKDGTIVPVELAVYAIEDQDGGHAGFWGFIRDITDRLYAQKEVQRRSEELAALNEIGQAIASTLDLQKTLTLITEYTTRLMGVAATSLLLHDETQEDLWFAAGSGEDVENVLDKRLPMGQGIAGWVAQHGEPALVPNVAEDPRWFGGFDQQAANFVTESILCVPLQTKGRNVGAIEVLNKKRGVFDEDDLRLLSAIAAPAATAIENAQLFEAVQRQLEELTVLNALAIAATEASDEDTLIERATGIIGATLYADDFGVALLDRAAGMLRPHASYRYSEPVKVRPVPLGTGISGQVAADGQPRRVPDVRRAPSYVQANPHTRSELCVPLKSGEQVIGVLNVESDQLNAFTEADERLLMTIAGQLATALEKARLFDAERASREQLQALSRRLVEVQEAERRHIARELHDETGQALSSLLLGLSLIEREADRPEAVIARATDLESIADRMLENLHRLAMNLRPASLDHLGLVAALQQYLETFESQHGPVVQFEAVGLEGERLSPSVETALYRIAQEALTNVMRHAQAAHVDVLLERRGDAVVIIVEDDGVGFDAQAAQSSGRLGLFGIRERAEMLGGILTIESALGKGTTLLVEVPYAHPDSNSR